MLRFFTISVLALISLASCTVVTTTNVPGKTATKFPKDMLGNYTLHYPETMLMGGTESSETFVTIKSNEIIMENADGITTTRLGDSLFFSTIGKQQYISLGKNPKINVFKVVKSGTDIHLFSMCGDVSSSGDLTDFFSSVREVKEEPDENGESEVAGYEVTIIDDKLDDYFDSDIPMRDPFILKKR